ncbi:MAG: LamG-like jellyroll fold domain-containing protein [Patescibacteria group bacterium]
MKKINLLVSFFLGSIFLLAPFVCRALPPGTLLYRTSNDGKMYGYSQDPIIYAENGIVKSVNSGHAALYIGQEDGVDYIVEALSDGIVKTPAKYFVNEANGEKFLGAKIPRDLSSLQQAKVIALAKSLVDKKLKYDFDFKHQKGPKSGEWTCVGLTEKLYESANISNPNNLGALEYDPRYYALDITPDGFDKTSIFNERGDCFSSDREFSKIAPYKNLLIPAPELIGYDAGLEYQGDRYIFFPYTQFLQPSLENVAADIQLSDSFKEEEIRGRFSTLGLVLRWSLINNPLSSLKNIAQKTKELAVNLKDKLFGSGTETAITLNDADFQSETDSKKSSAKKETAAKKTAAKKTASQKTTAPNAPAVKVNVKKKSAAVDSSKNETVASTTPKTSTAKTPKKAETTNPKKSVVKTAASSTVVTAYYNSTPTPATPTASIPVVYSSGSSQTSGDTWPKIARINRIYSTGDNDWIELYNPTDHDFDLGAAGYRLEKAKAAVDPTFIMRIGNPEDGSYPGGTIIKAHDRYLIVKNEANNYYRQQADALATRDDFFWPGSAYTLYLGTDAISSNTDPDIVDAVGFGSEATYFQGTAPASAITDNYILNRIAAKNDNSLDFNLIKADDPSIIWEIPEVSTTTDEVATTTDETATSTDEVATTTEEIATTTAETTTSTLPVDWPKIALINKIYSTGNNDWLELFNPTEHDFDLALADFRLEKTMTAATPTLLMRIGNPLDGLYPGGTIIKALSNYLIVREEANDYYKSKAAALATRDDFSWTDSGYTIYLGNGSISSSTDENILEAVGFGPEATYFQGTRPALTIKDNYILNRIATTSDNYLDFNLIPADDPSIIWSTTTPATTSLSLFTPPVPINSVGIRNLWHFDECYGAGKWAVGRWDCAREIGFTYEPITATLTPEVNLNNFSLSFYYKKSRFSPDLDFKLANAAGQYLRINIQPGFLQLQGLPNSKGDYYLNIFSDDLWHQFVLTVDQTNGRWLVYLDGEKVYEQTFIQSLPDNLTMLTIGGDQGSVLIDEIAIWNRPLLFTEVVSYYQNPAPFSPLAEREPQQSATLINFWDFSEGDQSAGIASTTQDNVGGVTLNVLPELWTWRALNNSALKSKYGRDLQTDLLAPLVSKDLSLAFWWRNSSYPGEGKTKVSLKYNEHEMLGLVAGYYRQSFYFNHDSGILKEGINDAIPYDNLWHHLALTYDSYRYLLRFYVDGEEKRSIPYIWIKDGEEINRLEIKSESETSEIDDLRVYEGALREQEIQAIFSNTK